jgi:hypothetical protein
MKENLLPVGTRVFDIRFGWGEITKSDYPYNVKFINDNDIVAYTINGKCYESDLVPTLSLTEYTLENGGFTPLSDYNKPKVGDIGYFWDNDMENKKRLLYSEVTKISNINNNRVFYYDSIANDWENFSIEIPEWFKNIMNEEGRNK